MRLADETIIVTGASSGLGRAMAEAFVSEGADVIVAARSADELSAFADEQSATGPGRAYAVPTDVRSWPAVQSLFEAAVAEFGPLDVVVNNAGVTQLNMHEAPTYLPVVDVPVDVWDGIIETNLRGVFLCTKAALGEMLPRDHGRLIHVSSGHGVEGRPNRSPYVASKWGVEGFHGSVSAELAETGVESVTLRPPSGGVLTENKATYGRDPDSFTHQDPSVIAESAVQLAAGAGSNGGRYQTTADGESFEEYSH